MMVHETKAVDLEFVITAINLIYFCPLSVLKALNHTSSNNTQIPKRLEKCHGFLFDKEIILCLIPSHRGIQGNEKVDLHTKTSLTLGQTDFKIPFSNFKPSINKYILDKFYNKRLK